jgi:biotin operon repressor
MSDMSEPIAFALPKKPRIKEQEAPPDQRKVAVLPIKAVFDQRMTHGALQALAALCAYCNRAGITWVSQKRLATELGITQQAYSKQFRQLVELGYVEVVRTPFKGQRSATTRVVYDPSVTAEDAITMVSNKEDARPPYMKEQQMTDMEPDREGLKRIAQLVAGALKQPNKPKEYTMPKTGDTMQVRKVKEQIAKATGKRSSPVDKSVDKSAHLQPPGCIENPSIHNPQVVRVNNPQVVLNTDKEHREVFKEGIYKESINNLKTVMNNQEVKELIDNGMTVEQVREAEELIAPLFAAEGIAPSSAVMAQAIMQMHRDAA